LLIWQSNKNIKEFNDQADKEANKRGDKKTLKKLEKSNGV